MRPQSLVMDGLIRGARITMCDDHRVLQITMTVNDLSL